MFIATAAFSQQTNDPLLNPPKNAQPQQPPNSQAQTGNGKQVEIIHADEFRFLKTDSGEVRKLVGSVELMQDDVLMYCDSALIYRESNSLDAFGHVHINQNDSIKVWSDLLFYDGNQKLATLVKNVRLTDGEVRITTDRMTYSTDSETAWYTNGAVINNGPTRITSKRGYYYSKYDNAYFRDDVVINDPDYNLISDTLLYNTGTEVATFFGRTEIQNESSTIICYEGWYDTQRELASLGKNTTIDNFPQVLHTDSLYYMRKSGMGRVYDKFTFEDPDMEVIITGNKAIYNEQTEFLKAYDDPLMIYMLENDSLLLAADTLRSEYDALTDIRTFYAYYGVEIFKSDLQGVCDSLYYSFSDSTFRMYYDPVAWSSNSQMTGDTIVITTYKRSIDQIFLQTNAFIASESIEGELYDQISGRDIYGLFLNDELSRMLVEGNAQSIYYGKNDEDAFVGGNLARCARMRMWFENNDVSRINFLGDPEATFVPISQMTGEQSRLPGFVWRIEERPLSKEDLRD